MNLSPFKLEEFWKRYEFSAPYLLCCSDAETWAVAELLEMADPEAKRLWDNLSLAYTESPGHPLLREAISQLYDHVGKEQILTFAGAEEGIYCAMKALLSPGDHAIVVQPCYQSLEEIPRSAGAEVTPIVLDPKRGWRLGLEQIRKAVRPDTKLFVLNVPHNPTGMLLERGVYEGLIELARERGAYIFSDEVYRFLEFDEQERLPSIADCYERGISLNVMTKSFGLAGLRIGWIASQDASALERAGSYKLYTSICNSAPSEILALIALRAKERILQRNRKILLDNFALLERFMERNRGLLSWTPPRAGTMALIELLAPVSVDSFAEELVGDQGILIMPSSAFDLPGNYFRIGFGKRNMAKILERFESWLTRSLPRFLNSF